MCDSAWQEWDVVERLDFYFYFIFLQQLYVDINDASSERGSKIGLQRQSEWHSPPTATLPSTLWETT